MFNLDGSKAAKKLDGTYHGKEVDPTKFSQGAALLQKVAKGMEPAFQWAYDTALPASLLSAQNVTVGGGQLKQGGLCLGFTADNYAADADYPTRARLEKCLTAADAASFPSADAFVAKAKSQLWTAELAESSDVKVVLRNVCSDLVLKKISTEDTEAHQDKVFAGQKCKDNIHHFDVAVVDRSKCIDSNMYGVNNCLFEHSTVQ